MNTFLQATIAAAVPLMILPGAAAAQSSVDTTFAAMDANRDGHIDKAEFTGFTQARQSRQATAMDAAFRDMDKDGDGHLSKAEAAPNPVIAGAFTALDADRDGKLSSAEMRAALAKAQADEATR